MFKFRTIGRIEHGNYAFVDAVTDKDVLNGAFGDVSDGNFTANENGKFVIMQIENSDDEGMAEYKIPAGSHVRVLDVEKADAVTPLVLEVYGYPLPELWEVGDALGCFTIKEVIGNKIGAVVEPTDE